MAKNYPTSELHREIEDLKERVRQLEEKTTKEVRGRTEHVVIVDDPLGFQIGEETTISLRETIDGEIKFSPQEGGNLVIQGGLAGSSSAGTLAIQSQLGSPSGADQINPPPYEASVISENYLCPTCNKQVQGIHHCPLAPDTQILIKIGDRVIGAVQSITFEESRMFQGFDFEYGPSPVTSIKGELQRVRFDRNRLIEIFNKSDLASPTVGQTKPLTVAITSSNGSSTELLGVWITQGLGYALGTDDWIVIDGPVKFEAKRIETF